jgi:hypothetical protein
MQLSWLTAAALGLCLGFVLDGCVNVRNQLCTIARHRYAAAGYWAIWVAALAVMLGLANVALWGLSSIHGAAADLLTQSIFLVFALVSAGILIRRRIRRCSACDDAPQNAHR